MSLNYFGRSTIGIEGPDGTIDLDVVTSFKQSYGATVTKFPIEKAPGEEPNISDYAIPGEMTLTLEAVVASNVNLIEAASQLRNGGSLAETLSQSALSAREKVVLLAKWMRQGSVLTIHGYGTGGGKLPGTKALSSIAATGSLDTLYQGDMDDPFVFGLDTDTIQNVVLTSAEPSRDLNNGRDVGLSLKFTRVRKVTPGASVAKKIPRKVENNPPPSTKSTPNPGKVKACGG